MFAAVVDELTGLPAAALDDRLAAAKARRDAADMEIAAITAVVESRRLFEDHGHRSVNGYLQQQLNCPAAEARKIKRRGRLVNRFPEVGDAWGASRVGAAQVDQLADAQQHRVAGARFAEFASLLAADAERLEFVEFKTAVEYYIARADPDGAFDDQRFREDQRTASVTNTGGAVSVDAFGGDPIQAEEMKAIFDRAVDAEFHKDCDDRRRVHGDDHLAQPLARTGEQRKFDALHEIFLASVTAPADGKRPEPVVNIVVDPTTGIDALARHGLLPVDDDPDAEPDPVDPAVSRCHTASGVAVHPDVAVAAMLRGSVRRVIVDADDVVINMGRRQRLFTGTARAAAKLLVTRCRYRGCNVPAEFCDIDHVDEWTAHHGRTDQPNAAPLCGVHDRWKHRQRLRGRRDRHGRLHFVRPDGSVIKPLNARDPDWANPPPRTLTWAARTGGAISTRPGAPWPHAVVTIDVLSAVDDLRPSASRPRRVPELSRARSSTSRG